MTQKNLIPKPLKDSKLPLIWQFIDFEVKKIRPQNIAIKWHKNCIFFLSGPKPIQEGH
jgi:hypothetical protein